MDRLSRQEQYFEKFIPKAKKAVKRNVFLGIDICNKLDKKGMMYTDMSMSEIAYVISEVLKCNFSFAFFFFISDASVRIFSVCPLIGSLRQN